MSGEYRKFNIEIKRENPGYRLWKRGMDGAACVMESYKNKRSVYFAVSNLMPSAVLLREENKEYHLVLLGVFEGEIIHEDFGAFFVNHHGEGSLFKKFTGPDLECYTHCLLVVLERSSGKTETLFSGTAPFFKEPQEDGEAEIKPLGFAEIWGDVFAEFEEENAEEFFTSQCDETGARWRRVNGSERPVLPMSLMPCRDLIAEYGHYLVGKKEDRYFAAVPGRFLLREQPRREEGCFSLWQPIRGGEKFFDTPENMSEALQEEIFGYWIGEIDAKTGEITAV